MSESEKTCITRAVEERVGELRHQREGRILAEIQDFLRKSKFTGELNSDDGMELSFPGGLSIQIYVTYIERSREIEIKYKDGTFPNGTVEELIGLFQYDVVRVISGSIIALIAEAV